MIEFDVVDYLLTDATLKTLLSWTGSDPKIYPVQAPEGVTVPYVLFDSGVGDSTDELIDEDRIQLTTVGESLANAYNIKARIITLLDKQDEIQQTTLRDASSTYTVYYSKKTGGTQKIDTENKEFNLIMYFSVKYRKKTF